MPETTVTASDNGRAIEVASGDELIIEVSENPTTGFRWALDGNLPDGLSLTASDFEDRKSVV